MEDNKRRWLISVLILIIIGQMTLIYKYLPERSNHDSVEMSRILFHRVIPKTEREYELFIINGNGENIQWIHHHISGPAVWSNDGKFIAAECFDEFKGTKDICIFDSSTIPDYKNLKAAQIYSPSIAFKIEIPEPCNLISPDHNTYGGIISLSWSPRDDRLALVCDGLSSTDIYEKEICIINISGEFNCWNEGGYEHIYQVAWSSKENVLASGGMPHYDSKIFLYTPDGKKLNYLADGWAPEWSPDGERVSYVRYEVMGEEVVPKQNGIAVIDKDGSNMEWLYLSSNPPESVAGQIIFEACVSPTHICNLTWSPDGHYIAFVAGTTTPSNYKLMRLNIKTGEVINLVHRNVIGNYILYPDWGISNEN